MTVVKPGDTFSWWLPNLYVRIERIGDKSVTVRVIECERWARGERWDKARRLVYTHGQLRRFVWHPVTL